MSTMAKTVKLIIFLVITTQLLICDDLIVQPVIDGRLLTYS